MVTPRAVTVALFVLFGLLVAAGQSSLSPRVWAFKVPSSSSPPSSATDDFERTSASPMTDGSSITWTNGPGATGNMRIVNNSDADGASGVTYGCARVLTPTFSADHWAETTIASGGGSVVNQGPCVRIASNTDADCYLMVFSAATNLRLYRIADTGSIGFTTLTNVTTGSSVAAGDVLRLQIVGSTLTLFHKGTNYGSVIDSTYSTGQPGIWSSSDSMVHESFSASDAP